MLGRRRSWGHRIRWVLGGRGVSRRGQCAALATRENLAGPPGV